LKLQNLIVKQGGLALYPDRRAILQTDKEPGKQLATKTFMTTRFIAALVLFLGVNLTFKVSFHPDPYSLPEHSFIWWAVHDYQQLKQEPDIVLFGSSLMLAAVNQGDATHYRKLVDTATHHQCSYLEELLKKEYGQGISTFCFAIGGQMASDVYAIGANFITDRFKPRTVIWGIAPRDLIDAAFPGPITSDTALYMNKIAGKEVIADHHKSLITVVDQFLSRALFLYRVRQDLISIFRQTMRSIQVQQMKWLLAICNNTSASPPPGRSVMLRELMNPRDGTMGDIEVGEWLIGANAEPSKTLKDNTHEYMMRYNPFKPKTFALQREYLEKFLRMQKDLGVKVILVNMPLTGVNMSLLSDSIYDLYLNTIKDTAAKYGASVVNLNGDSHFAQCDFFDTAHLNGIGSQKFIERLSNCNIKFSNDRSALAASCHPL